jgi:osmoprotectant transport system permease protein
MTGYLVDHGAEITDWVGWHIRLAGLPLLFGLLIALPLGWLARRHRWTYPPMISLTGLLYTIPSIALFVVLPGILHTQVLDPLNVIVALTIYTVALLVRVVADGLATVPHEVLLAADAMGYRSVRRFVAVELPIALPVIAAGLRVAAVSNVSLVAIAATVGVPQLGQLFTVGFQLSYPAPILDGIVLCVLLAFAFDAAILLGVTLLTRWRRAVRPA